MKTIPLLILTGLTTVLGCGGDADDRSDASTEWPPPQDSGQRSSPDADASPPGTLDATTRDGSAVEVVTPDSAAGDVANIDHPAMDSANIEMAAGWDAPGAADVNGDGIASLTDAFDVGCTTVALGATPPTLLSGTGCFTPGVPTQPVADFMPYEVNSPLWSDGATKERFLKVPRGSTIAVKDCDRTPGACLPPAQGGSTEDEGHFDLPVGTILIKVFSLQERRIETRLLLRVSDTVWKTYSYQWNNAATEATLGPDGGDRTVGSQVWHYPSQGECTLCHTLAAGRSLGPTTRQLDRTTAAGNQIDLLVARGWLAERPKALSPLPDPKLDGPIEGRARSYLQSNCSFCHRPGSNISDMDMRYATTLFEMNVCNVPIQRGLGDPGIPQARVVPGKPSDSALSFRMHDRAAGYNMPRIGSNLVDPTGTGVVDQWIGQLTGCPSAP